MLVKIYQKNSSRTVPREASKSSHLPLIHPRAGLLSKDLYRNIGWDSASSCLLLIFPIIFGLMHSTIRTCSATFSPALASMVKEQFFCGTAHNDWLQLSLELWTAWLTIHLPLVSYCRKEFHPEYAHLVAVEIDSSMIRVYIPSDDLTCLICRVDFTPITKDRSEFPSFNSPVDGLCL